MKTFNHKISSLLLILLCTSCMAFAQKSFEGFVEMSLKGTSTGDANVKWVLKDGNFKMSLTGGATGAFTIIVLQDGAMKLIGADGTMIDVSNAIEKDSERFLLKKTGATKTIAGYNAYEIADDKGLMRAWISEETGLSLNDLPSAAKQGAFKVLAQNGVTGFPLEVNGTDGDRNVSFNITKLQKATVDGSEFDLSQYKQTEVKPTATVK